MAVSRELEEICRAMNSMTTEDDLADFLNNPENAQRLNGLVEDIRYALMDYQVCIPKHSLLSGLTSASDFAATRYQ